HGGENASPEIRETGQFTGPCDAVAACPRYAIGLSMSSIIDCPACSRKLRVPDELIGTQVKCPTCSETFNASAVPPTTVDAPSKPRGSLELNEPARYTTPPISAKTDQNDTRDDGLPPALQLRVKLLLDEQEPGKRTDSGGQRSERDQSGSRPSSPRSPIDLTDEWRPCPRCSRRISTDAKRCRH